MGSESVETELVKVSDVVYRSELNAMPNAMLPKIPNLPCA